MAPALPDAPACDALILGRRQVSPRHLVLPGPGAAELQALFAAAAAAPDHRQRRPWRFLVLGARSREQLADCFEQALLERDPRAEAEQRQEARAKARRGPVLLLAIADLPEDDPDVPPAERLVALGAALQNLMLAARARGYTSALSSGRALRSAVLRQAFGVQPSEQAVCFVTLGTPARERTGAQRPAADEVADWLD